MVAAAPARLHFAHPHPRDLAAYSRRKFLDIAQIKLKRKSLFKRRKLALALAKDRTPRYKNFIFKFRALDKIFDRKIGLVALRRLRALCYILQRVFARGF